VASAYLCANKPKRTAGADIYNGTTIDQLIAQKIGQETLLPSMQLAVEDPGANSSNCGEGYSCSYTNSISWIELPTPESEHELRTSPLPMELNPQVVFERLFGSGATPEVRAARLRENRSILDSLLGELSGLGNREGCAHRLWAIELGDCGPRQDARPQMREDKSPARANQVAFRNSRHQAPGGR
jgi:hypothetical protein